MWVWVLSGLYASTARKCNLLVLWQFLSCCWCWNSDYLLTIYFWLYFQAWTQKQKRVWSIILLIDSTSFKHNCVLYTWSLDTVTYLVSLFFMVLFCFCFCFCKSCLQRNHILSQIFRRFSLQIKLNHISVILFHFNSYWYCICKNIK